MTPDERKRFRQEFYRSLSRGPLEPDDPQYVALYDLPELRNDDPVELLRFAIDANPTPTAQLLSGFRGTGKSTELRRLRHTLKAAGYRVLLLDVEDYLNVSAPVDVTEFLVAFALAVSEAVAAESGDDALHRGYAERLWQFLRDTEVSLPEVSAAADLGPTKLTAKLLLKDNPGVQERVRARWQSSLGALVRLVHGFVETVAKDFGGAHQVVVLVDSVEHIQGTADEAAKVQSSVERLFTAHADILHFPGLHTVYTVHPYLKIKYANLDDYYPSGGLQIVPTLKVRERGADGDPTLGAARRAALDAVARVIEARGHYWHLLGAGERGRQRLDALILHSGGHLRDLIRLLSEIVRRALDLPVSDEVFEAAVNHVRNQALPIADDDARWLAEIARSRTTCLPSDTKLPSLARFLDTHRVLCYRNGSEWFDVHPLIRDVVLAQAAAVSARTPKTP